MCILHRYLVPTLVHLRTYQVRPFLAPLLQNGDFRKRKFFKKRERNSEGGVAFLCMQNAGKIGAVGMKVDNVHEFVKKINNAASVG